jgi:hypothetical protein
MTELRVDVGDVHLVVRRATVRDRLAADVLTYQLEQEQGSDTHFDRYARQVFVKMMTQTVIATGLPFQVIGSDEPASVRFQHWLMLDATVFDAWDKALARVNAPLVDADLAPPEQLSDEKKENSPTSD